MNHSNAKTVWTSQSGVVSIAVAGDIVIALQSGQQAYQHGLRTAKNLFVRVTNQPGVYSIGGTKLCVRESDLANIKEILANELALYQQSETEEQKLHDVAMNEFNSARQSCKSTVVVASIF